MSAIPTAARTDIVFVFDNLPDWQQLAAGVREGAQVVVLDGARDGLAQIAAHLQGRTDVDALHILSHGQPGSLQLGSLLLDQAALAEHADVLAQIGSALSESGDILLYGCAVADGQAGAAYTHQWAALTRADAAASDDVTGPASQGGDWALELHAGLIEAPAPWAHSNGPDYAHLLAPINNAPTFAPATPGTGKLVTDIGSGTTDYGQSVTVQADGKIVVAGYSHNGSSYDFALVRYNADGTLDTSFGSGGKQVTDIGSYTPDVGRSITVQADGKIVAAGYSHSAGNNDFAVVRYNTDGTLDTNFGSGGKLVTNFGSGTRNEGQSATVQVDGKIVVAGYSNSGGSYNFAVMRYNADGSMDTSFGTGGTGKLVTDFGSNTYDQGRSVTVQVDGKIVVAGYSDIGGPGNFAVVRYNTNGTLDTSFNGTGKLVTNFGSGTHNEGQSVTVQVDGKIVVAGYSGSGSQDFAVVRYNADGSLDTSFGSGGKLVTDFGSGTDDYGYSVTVQANGKIVVAGISDSGGSDDFAVVRYNADGSLDTSFNGTGKLVTDIGSSTSDGGQSVTVQVDGKIVVAGYSNSGGASSDDFAVVRYNTDGSLDTSFNPGPAGNTLNGVAAYTENAPAVVLDASVAVFDADLAALNGGLGNYSGASVTLARAGGSATEDVFSALGSLAFTGGNAVLSGTTVGTVTQAAGTLTITFNANATQALVNTTLSSIGYANASEAPPASVQIDWTFSDGNTGAQGGGAALTVAGSTMVNITAVNDAPTVAIPLPDKSTLAGTVFSFQFAANTFADVDVGDTLTYAAQLAGGGALPAWLIFDDGTRTFSGTPATANVGTVSIDVMADDGHGGTVTDTFDIVISTAPVVTPPDPDPEPPVTPPTPPVIPGVPDDDGIPAIIEDKTPGIPGPDGITVDGDGNGDGIKDSEQAGVASIGVVLSPTGESNPGSAPPTFTTLVASSQDGKVSGDPSNSRITSLSQKDAPTDLPHGLETPIGLVSFTVELAQGKTGEDFSLYIDPALEVNGYWKQDNTGTWVNIASEPYGGKMVMEGGRVRLDFHIEDGGQFDADGKADGIITDPGAPGHMPLSIAGQAPDMPQGFWF